MDASLTKSDPNRSVLGVLIENLKKFGRKNYLHRFVYVFEYTKPNPDFVIYDIIGELIKKVNENFCDEPLTGVLLYYQCYGVNMIEGSEETILKHLQELVSSKIIIENVGCIKILLTVSHIKTRLFNNWTYFTGQPQTLLTKIDINSTVEETSKQLRVVISKLFATWQYLKNQPKTFERNTNIEKLTDSMTTNLPEFSRLEFVLATPALQELKEFVDSQRNIHQPVLYQEMVWPQQTDYVPYGVLTKKSILLSSEAELEFINN